LFAGESLTREKQDHQYNQSFHTFLARFHVSENRLDTFKSQKVRMNRFI